MQVGDNVKANINEDVLFPKWVNGVIESIYITLKKNFYLIKLETGDFITLEQDYVQEV